MAEKKSRQPSDDGKKRQVTLRDIAKELDISHVTVSLALRDHPRISEATRAKVKKKAEEMGYHPDPMLSALSHYRLTSKEKPVQATLAWLNPLKNPEKLRQFEEFDLYWKGAESVANKLGFQLEEFTTQELSLKRMNTIFKTRSIRGILLVPLGWNTTPVNWDDMPWKDYAAVRFGRSRQGPKLNFVTSAQASNTVLAFEKAEEKGYKRIGFIGNSSRRRMFSAGYLRAQQAVPKNRQLSMLMYESNDTEWDHALHRDALERWLEKEKPDAIITANVILPSLLEELGYSVPGDIGIATTSITDTPINAGIDQNPEEIGRATVRALVALVNEHHFGIPEIRNQTLVEGVWVDGSMLPDRT
ncbi:LacI family DNA-binding transcriptional regulator [Pontiellaceae bacterium B12227]|nr:LacI family DNA-binding transcriptional regulator [Pontiellaceae bacterium B12227]